VAGALGALFADGIQRRYEIVGLSGTSGGAFTAALAWMGLLQQARGDSRPIEDRIIACWKDLTAQTPQEIAIDEFGVQLLRLVERGLLPSVATSPSSPRFWLWSQATSALIARPEFTDLRALLDKHLDFAALPSLIGPGSPVLLVGAADVLEGSFKIFSSARGEISVDALLASAAIPTLFPAANVGGHAYWDGIFSSNPPVAPLLRMSYMGSAPLAEEIWIIQVNRSRHLSVPETSADIMDRRNHLAGNLSLQHELQLIDLMNLLLREGALTADFRARFAMDASHPVQVRFIRMSREIEESLDYPSKLSRQPAHIARLLADGESQARIFMAGLAGEDRTPELGAEAAVAGP
jgi:NTE family protein